MEVDECSSEAPMVVEGRSNRCDWSGRWSHVQKLLMRSGPLAHQDFEPGSHVLEFMLETAKILVIGAGGLGCELLKNLALCGFKNIDVIDMDTIDVSNLNRQFLFRPKDIGKPKAVVAADFINSRIAGCNVTPNISRHFKKIQDYGTEFYRGFHLIVCGLDSIAARRWMNGMVLSLLEYDEDDALDQTSIIPMVDGGTEGFKGNARVIVPGLTACVECTLDLYPPQVNFPLCTIAHTPRLPEHCIEYAKVLVWPQEHPFGGEIKCPKHSDVPVDGDDPAHVQWIYDKAKERADSFNIQGVTYRLTQGVVKHIIPAVASTNAVIAAACSLEVFKLVSSCCNPLNNYMIFNDTEGLYTYTFEAERKPAENNTVYLNEKPSDDGHVLCFKMVQLMDDCPACSQRPQRLAFPEDATLQSVIDFFVESPTYQMKAPGLTTVINGKNKTLYMQSVKSIEERTRENLPKKLKDIGFIEGQEVVVADVSTPKPLVCRIHFTSDLE